MSRWLDLARSSLAEAGLDAFGANGAFGTGSVDKPARDDTGPIGANDTIGTAPRDTSGRTESGPIGANDANDTASPIPLNGLRALFDLILDRAGGDRAAALAIVRAQLRNDPRLAPIHLEIGRCQVCRKGDLPGNANALLPFLGSVEGTHMWLHENCHAEYVEEQNRKVDACLRAAGIMGLGRGLGSELGSR